MQKLLLYFFTTICLYCCHNHSKKEQLILGIYINKQDRIIQQFTFKSDNSLTFHLLDPDSNLITSDCNYYISNDTIFINSVEHRLQSHIQHLTLNDTLLIVGKRNLIDFTSKELFTKQQDVILNEYNYKRMPRAYQ